MAPTYDKSMQRRMHSGYFPIVPGSESLFMSSSCYSLFNVIKYALGRYYKYKISDSHQNILQKSKFVGHLMRMQEVALAAKEI